MLSDLRNKVVKAYGLVYRLTKVLVESYHIGFDIHGYNGDSSDELSLASTHIINQKGMIIYAFLDAE